MSNVKKKKKKKKGKKKKKKKSKLIRLSKDKLTKISFS